MNLMRAGKLAVSISAASPGTVLLLLISCSAAEYVAAPIPKPPPGTISTSLIGNSVEGDYGSFLNGTGKDLREIHEEPKFSGFFGDVDVSPSGDSIVLNYGSELSASNVIFNSSGSVLGRAGRLGGTAVALSDERQWTGGCPPTQRDCSPGPERRHTIFIGNQLNLAISAMHLMPYNRFTFPNLYVAKLSSEPYPQEKGGAALPGPLGGSWTEYAKWNMGLRGDQGWDPSIGKTVQEVLSNRTASANYPLFQDISGLAVWNNLLFVAVDQDRNPPNDRTKKYVEYSVKAVQTVQGGSNLNSWIPLTPEERSDAEDKLWIYDLASRGNPNPEGVYRLLGVTPIPNLWKMASNPDGKSLWALQRSKTGEPLKAVLINADPHSSTFGSVRQSIVELGWNPTDIAVDRRNGNVLISDAGPDRQIKIFSPEGQRIGEFGIKGGVFETSDGAPSGLFRAGAFSDPQGLGIDAEGNLYVADGIRGTRGGTYQSFSPLANSWKREFRWVHYNVTDWDTPVIDPKNPTIAYTAYVKLKYEWPSTPSQHVKWQLTNYIYNPDLGQMDFRSQPNVYQNLQQVVYLNGKPFLELTSGTLGRMFYYRFEGGIAVPAAMVTVANRPEKFAPGMVEAAPGILVQKALEDKNKRVMWSDTNGDGKLSPQEVTLYPGLKQIRSEPKLNMGDWQSAYVDSNGDLWQVEEGAMVRSRLNPRLLPSGAPAWNLDVAQADRFPWPENLLPGSPPAIFQYDAVTDSMYIAGGVTKWAECDNRPQPSLIKMTGYTTSSRKIAWTTFMGHFLIYNAYRGATCGTLTGYNPNGTPRRLTDFIASPPPSEAARVQDPNGEFNPPTDFDVAGDYIFMARMNGTGADVLSAATGQKIGTIASDVDGLGWLDQPQHSNAIALPNGQYALTILSVTNHRAALFQWTP